MHDGHDDAYELYQRGRGLLESGNPAAAAIVLGRLAASEPESRSVTEDLARALFDSGRHAEAAEAFERLLDLAPDDDYAHFGRGSSLWRLQDFERAEEHLAMAAVMRPERADYARSLRQVRATLRARLEAGLPLNGPLPADRDGQG